MRYVLGVIKGVFLIAVVLFCTFNSAPVEVRFLPNKFIFAMPLFLPIIASFFVGVILTGLFFIPAKVKSGFALKKANKELNKSKEAMERAQSVVLIDKAPADNAKKAEEIVATSVEVK